MVTQLDEERRRLWELVKANLEKVHKMYKDFADKSRREVKFQVEDEVWLNMKNFQLLEVYVISFWAHMRVHSKCWKRNFPTLIN